MADFRSHAVILTEKNTGRQLRQNEGMSGRPLWKIKLEQEEAAAQGRDATAQPAPSKGSGSTDQWVTRGEYLFHAPTGVHYLPFTHQYFRHVHGELVECDPNHAPFDPAG